MSIHQTYAVFGLGRYGTAVARELVNSGAEVLAVDTNEEIVNDLAAEFPLCKCADITDPDVITRLGISNIDTVIISMANNLEASVLAITLCKEVGVKNVIVKCSSEMHKKILLKISHQRKTTKRGSLYHQKDPRFFILFLMRGAMLSAVPNIPAHRCGRFRRHGERCSYPVPNGRYSGFLWGG